MKNLTLQQKMEFMKGMDSIFESTRNYAITPNLLTEVRGRVIHLMQYTVGDGPWDVEVSAFANTITITYINPETRRLLSELSENIFDIRRCKLCLN